MKRFIAILLITIILLICITGCAPAERCFVKIDEYNFNGFVIHVVYDPETMVEYFIRGDLMCPRYDKNGELTFYKGG